MIFRWMHLVGTPHCAWCGSLDVYTYIKNLEPVKICSRCATQTLMGDTLGDPECIGCFIFWTRYIQEQED